MFEYDEYWGYKEVDTDEIQQRKEDNSDAILLALCNRFDVEIVVAEATSHLEYKMKYVVKPNKSGGGSYSERRLYMLKTGNHYDSLVDDSGKNSFVLSVF